MQTSSRDESDSLDTLITPVDPHHFQLLIRRLHTLFNVYANTCPVPLPAPGQIVTPEIRSQCEMYLPIAQVASAFNHLYSAALTYQPILSSTPFHHAMSWADVFAALPQEFQLSPNPARLLELLLTDFTLLTRFLFASFLPPRFYGCIGRYPGQQEFVSDWLSKRKGRTLTCLDAACGTGEETYAFALLVSKNAHLHDEVRIDGWTLEPLEVWSARYRRFPNDRRRETLFRAATSPLFRSGNGSPVRFHCQDIFKPSPGNHRECFDIIICNGLLGGPIINENSQLNRAVSNLVQRLLPDGILLAADNFHGGWKQKCPQGELQAIFERNHLKSFDAGEGIGGLKSYQ